MNVDVQAFIGTGGSPHHRRGPRHNASGSDAQSFPYGHCGPSSSRSGPSVGETGRCGRRSRAHRKSNATSCHQGYPKAEQEPTLATKESEDLVAAHVSLDNNASTSIGSSEAEAMLPEVKLAAEKVASPTPEESTTIASSVMEEKENVIEEKSIVGEAESTESTAPQRAMMSVKFVHDVSIPDGTPLPPSSEFSKIWDLENAGDVIPAGTRVIFVGGESFSQGAGEVRIKDEVATGARFLVTLAGLRAPKDAGKNYTGFWRLANSEGQVFGDRLWIECVTGY